MTKILKVLKEKAIADKEFKKMVTDHYKKIPMKTIEFLDFTSFIVQNGVHEESDMIFMTGANYETGEFEGSLFGVGENKVWDCLEKLIGMGYSEMEKEFQSVKFEDNENTCLATFKGKEYAILVA